MHQYMFPKLPDSVSFRFLQLVTLLALGSPLAGVAATPEKLCSENSVALQVLGSGGPEISNRAGTSYLLWIGGQAKLLFDAGPGARLRFAESGAKIEDLDAVFLTHLHVDHANDLPALIKAGYFTPRTRQLDVIGPTGNAAMPGTRRWLGTLLGNDGYRYLSGHLAPHDESEFAVIGVNVNAQNSLPREVWRTGNIVVKAAAVGHGSIPALAYRIEGPGFSFAISGDTHGEGASQKAIQELANNATLFVAHHAIPEKATGAAKQLHMLPSQIGRIAVASNTSRLVLSHRMKRTLGEENETTSAIRKYYSGSLDFAEDLDCLTF